jgi:peptide deformylase
MRTDDRNERDGAENPTKGPSRRELLRRLAGGALTLGAGGASLLAAGCGAAAGPGSTEPRGPAAPGWEPAEQALLESSGELLALPPVGVPAAALLRRRARELEPALDLGTLERRMRATLVDSGGVGLAAPQVGLGVRAILVTLDARSDTPRTVWCVNPRIVLRSDELQDDLEGCLSIPELCGLVRRQRALTVAYSDGAAEVELAVEGFDARIFQHEIDHLDGVLYTDRLLGPAAPKAALRPLRDELARRRGAGEAGDVLGPDDVTALFRAVLERPADAVVPEG